MDASTALQIDRLATAVAKDPRSKEFLPLADEYMKVGMWQEAAGVLEDGLKVYPGFVTAMVALGRVYDQLSQPGKAKTILEEVVKQRPDNLRAHRILAQLYYAEGKADLALLSCHAILHANPHDEEALGIKRRITGPHAEVSSSKRDVKPSDEKTRRESDKILTPISATSLSSLSNGDPSTHSPDKPIPEPPAAKHRATIARLHNWLRTIQLHRQDGDRRTTRPLSSSHDRV
jgi:tetratricopeptide (TPR) repeat protein